MRCAEKVRLGLGGRIRRRCCDFKCAAMNLPLSTGPGIIRFIHIFNNSLITVTGKKSKKIGSRNSFFYVALMRAFYHRETTRKVKEVNGLLSLNW